VGYLLQPDRIRHRSHAFRGCRDHPRRVRRLQPRGAIVNGGGVQTSAIHSPAANERILIMNMPAKADVDDATREALAGLALGDPELLLGGLELRAEMQQNSGLDPRSFAIVKIAALIALDAPPASYLWQVGNALDAGCTPVEIVGVLKAIAPQVGGPRIVAAAPELMVALGLSLPEGT
jgi:alkylhydroperoxidase/carboxymuconolactone decarboxylase family protein YurZ